MGEDDIQEHLGNELRQLKADGLMRTLDSGHGLLDFCSNDYLSLNSSGKLEFMLRELIARNKIRAGSSGSRLIRGEGPEFERAEHAFAEFVGCESALLFNSGYAANLGVLQALLKPRDTILCDCLAHASLLDGIRLSGARRIYFSHNDLNDLERRLSAASTAGSSGPRKRGRLWILAETVYSMEGDSPDLKMMATLAERYHAELILDEAHALGVVGPGGCGLVAACGLENRIAVTIFPCGKAPGLSGAFVCGSKNMRDYLVNKARSFLYSTAMSPMMAELLADVITLLPGEEMNHARKRAESLAKIFCRELNRMQSGESKPYQIENHKQNRENFGLIIPLIYGSPSGAVRAAKICRDEGFDVRAIRPPSVPSGTSRLRVTIQAGQREQDLLRFTRLIQRTNLFS